MDELGQDLDITRLRAIAESSRSLAPQECAERARLASALIEPGRLDQSGPGDAFWLPGDGVHRMDHEAGAVTIHVYSPPIRRSATMIEAMHPAVPASPESA
jgi:hypothetical protein